MGSFWDEPLHYDELRSLFEKEQDDLYQQIEQLPRSSTMNKINDLSKRARLCKAHALLLEHLRSQMPTMWGHGDMQQQLIADLGRVYNEASRIHKVPMGDFPDVNWMREKLMQIEFTQIKRLDPRKMQQVDELLRKGIPELLTMVPGEHRVADAVTLNKGGYAGSSGSFHE
jgi:hypothetical protein